MKLNKLVFLLAAGIALIAISGCKSPENLKRIPGQRPPPPPAPHALPPIAPEQPISSGPPVENTNTNGSGIPLGEPGRYDNYIAKPEVLAADTVYFDFDSSAVKSGERAKVASVADYLKGNPNNALRIEGHCDERGTEEYNRSLGERRALALREELVRLGVDPIRVVTISYGKDRPLDPGHDESAWKKNRRGEFIVLEPPPK